MKTPDEIKKSLECMKKAFDEKCDFKCDRCPVYVPGYKNTSMSVDALAYIRQLEAELETAKRERDAAVKDLWYSGECFDCKYRNNQEECEGTGCCYTCKLDCPCAKYPCGYEWRGVCPENTEVD